MTTDCFGARNGMASSSQDPSQPSGQNESSEGGCRPTFYMSSELLSAIEAQCDTEGNKKRFSLPGGNYGIAVYSVPWGSNSEPVPKSIGDLWCMNWRRT